jgi:hypothetical protein
MSHGHLSKVERGEHGRPVTPAVLAAYEKATGVRLANAAWPDDGSGELSGSGWRRGHLSDLRRRSFNAKVAAVAVGGPLAEPVARILDATGRTTAPARVEAPDVTQVELLAQLCTRLDLRFGGGVPDQLAKTLLRWSVGMLDAAADDDVGVRLYAAVGALAQRAGWSAFDADAHGAARALFTVALYAAAQADEPNLRGHVLADLAAQHNHLGYLDDCLRVARLGEVDERVAPAVRMVLYGVKARAYAAAGDPDACWRQVEQAEQAHAEARAGADPGAEAAGVHWLAAVSGPGRLYAATGHAAATLARRTGSEVARGESTRRLARAVDELDPVADARAVALCAARLAAAHLDGGDAGSGAQWAWKALEAARGIRSARVTGHLLAMRTAVAANPDGPSVPELVAAIDRAVEQ